MNEKIKAFFGKKQNVVISCVAVVLAVVILIVALTFGNEKTNIDESSTTSTTETTTESTTIENPTESTTKSTTESTTKKPETTTKKPNKTETTTKKPVTTTKPSNPDKVPEDIAKELVYGDYGGKEGYEAHLEEVRNYKCSTCGKHDCPSLEYGTDLLGNPKWPSISPEKCPAIINGTAKCPHCGKILVEDNRWQTEPDKYCRGTCHLNFG